MNKILFAIAMLLFAAKALGAAVPQVDLGWLGLAVFSLAFLIP